MANESINLNLIPKGDMPVIHVSQFDNGRQFNINMLKGSDEYTLPEGYTATLNCRKADRNTVTLATTNVSQNTLTFITTTQLCACAGENICEVVIKDANDYKVGSLNFILEVERDPLQGGIESTSEIHDLEDQIEEITAQVLSDNYYTKTETDTLLDAKANTADVYTKTQVDTALSAKANSADLATVATTGSYNDLTNKPTIPAAQVQSDYAQVDNTKVDYIKNKPDINGMIEQAIDNILPISTASGMFAVFNTDLEKKPTNITVGNTANTIYVRGFNQFDGVWTTGTYWHIANNLIRVLPGVTYFVYTPNVPENENLFADYYDASKTLISAENVIGNNQTFTLPDNISYIKLRLWGDFDYSNICINVSGTQDGTYQAYNSNSDDYSVSDINDIETLIGDNTMFADAGNISVSYKESIQHYIDRKVGT